MILAGDIGGTKTVLALFDEEGTTLRLRRDETYRSKDAAHLEDLVQRFLEASGRPAVRAACFGVAGAVVDGRTRATNLPWEIDEDTLEQELGIPSVRLLNDLEAAAYGVLSAGADTFVPLQPGRPRPGTKALIAAGTGLGEAVMAWDGQHHHVLASEGGHADFGPRTEVEVKLWEFLHREFGHVSYERILSGPGLWNVYRFLRHYRREEEPAWLTAQIAAGDAGAVISQAAQEGRDPVCAEALNVWVSIYGAEAGNLALKVMAVGGLCVGGGIAPKILPKLQDGEFIAAFLSKGRMADLMQTIPVSVVRDPRAPLWGAADRARRL